MERMKRMKRMKRKLTNPAPLWLMAAVCLLSVTIGYCLGYTQAELDTMEARQAQAVTQ